MNEDGLNKSLVLIYGKSVVDKLRLNVQLNNSFKNVSHNNDSNRFFHESILLLI